jgi:hypothetical protein
LEPITARRCTTLRHSIFKRFISSHNSHGGKSSSVRSRENAAIVCSRANTVLNSKQIRALPPAAQLVPHQSTRPI